MLGSRGNLYTKGTNNWKSPDSKKSRQWASQGVNYNPNEESPTAWHSMLDSESQPPLQKLWSGVKGGSVGTKGSVNREDKIRKAQYAEVKELRVQ